MKAKKWVFDINSLRKIYDEEVVDKEKISFEEFKAAAEHFANVSIENAKKMMEDETDEGLVRK